MKYISVIIFLFLGITLNAKTNYTFHDAPIDDYKDGLQYEVKGDYNKALECFTRAYKKGDLYYSPLKIAQYFITCKGIKIKSKDKDRYVKEGVDFAKISANNGNPDAMNLLGMLYSEGTLVYLDKYQAEKWFRLSAEKHGNAMAKFYLATNFSLSENEELKWMGEAIHERLEEAINYYSGGGPSERKLKSTLSSAHKKILNVSPQPDAEMCERNIRIASGYSNKNAFSSSSKISNNESTIAPSQFDQIITEANNGNVDAMLWLGWSYTVGEGVEQNHTEAFGWFMKAAEKGNNEAQIRVSFMLGWGIGTAKNYKLAFDWAQKAAKNNKPDGFYLLGCIYMNGIGTPINKEKSFENFLKAAQMGYLPAYRLTGFCYLYGKGTPKDEKEGFNWIQMAAQEGDVDSQGLLATCYIEGIGTSKNYYEAEKLANKAIEKEATTGYYALALLYTQETTKDIQKALKYVDRGIELVNKNSEADEFNDEILDFYDLKGRIYLKDGQPEKAREMAQMIAKINPDYNDTPDTSLMDFYYGRTNKDTQLANGQKPDIQSDVDVNIPANDLGNQNTFAIIIGNEHYEDVSDVEFANRDADSFAKYCEMVLGVPSTNIRKYKDASYGKMIGALEDIRSIAKAYNGDLNIIFYYAGHGIPSEKDFSSYLLPVDGSGRSTSLCLSLNNLYETLAETDANRILVFLDACFSGATRGDGMLTAARGVAIKAQPEEPRKNMVIFSASSDDETAYPLKEQGHGLFTYYLLKKLQESKGNLTLAELSKYINENVRKQSVVINRKSQTPTTSGTVDLNVNWFTK